MKHCILMVGPGLNVKKGGGISSVVRTYLNSSLTKKYNIIYIHTMVEGTKMKSFFIGIKGLLRIIYLLLTQSVELVHIHTSSGWSFRRKAFVLLLAKIFRKKTILHLHSGGFEIFYNEENRTLGKKIIRKVFNSASCIITLSSSWKKFVREITLNKSIRILNNPVDFYRIYRQIGDINETKKPGNLIFFMGEIKPGKGVYDIVKAFPSVAAQIPKVKAIFAGVGEINNLNNLCEKLEVDMIVETVGWVNESRKIEFFRTAKIFVLPSYYEGVPITLLEAMSAGLPIVTTPVGGIPDVFEDGINGYLIEPGDIDALSNTIVRLLKDEKLREIIGKNNIKKVKEEFDINVVVRKLSKIYEELLSRV
jgi:glycosyltransferase involved in cell wall biosynthesis